ncbi:hypothetical protein [Salinispira pacifica]
MKRIAAVVLSLFVSAGAFAQNIPDFNTYEKAFVDFAHGVSSALPLYSSIGNNWSSGYGGQLPHLGFGLTVGAATIPGAVVDNLTTQLGLGSVTSIFPSAAADLIKQYGVPMPGYVIEARIGGLFIPFDIGLKFGYFGDKMQSLQQKLPANMKLDTLLAGFDVKFPLVKEGFLMPQISIGGGFSYVKGYVQFPLTNSDITVLNGVSAPDGNTYWVKFTAPNMRFQWDSKVIDAKIQVSKHLLIFTPYAGVGASYGFSGAGGGVASQLLVSTTSNSGPFSTPTAAQIDQINQALSYSGNGGSVSVDGTSVLVSAGANGLGFRAFGGVSVDLLILHLDANLMYDILGKSYGGSIGVRIQW